MMAFDFFPFFLCCLIHFICPSRSQNNNNRTTKPSRCEAKKNNTQIIFDWNLDKILFCDFCIKIPFHFRIMIVFFSLLFCSLLFPIDFGVVHCSRMRIEWRAGGCDRAIKMNWDKLIFGLYFISLGASISSSTTTTDFPLNFTCEYTMHHSSTKAILDGFQMRMGTYAYLCIEGVVFVELSIEIY